MEPRHPAVPAGGVPVGVYWSGVAGRCSKRLPACSSVLRKCLDRLADTNDLFGWPFDDDNLHALHELMTKAGYATLRDYIHAQDRLIVQGSKVLQPIK